MSMNMWGNLISFWPRILCSIKLHGFVFASDKNHKNVVSPLIMILLCCKMFYVCFTIEGRWFLVCNFFHLETLNFAFPYFGSWPKRFLKETMNIECNGHRTCPWNKSIGNSSLNFPQFFPRSRVESWDNNWAESLQKGWGYNTHNSWWSLPK